ncbi:Sarcosine oxidase gamma subunit [Rhodovulum sp. P5]|uniref:sarcosine oxidase subunit gamma n=1 Tax=Rhodovulum sp. P5 TaxID=1564506 RepID=UPI0009C27D61|nr:sarcosine oxidase subunit gamma family protein [Rhodovulum sp. P5]ARE38604.1 Sarcosine oxidase gamma subunit [Rhodovulum sp. P5]
MPKTVSSLTPSVVADTSAARVSVSGMAGRISLRARGDLSAINSALGLALPAKIGGRAAANGIEAACLGPDEWTLILPMERVAPTLAALAAIYPDTPHSAVDISGREVTFVIEGARAAGLLTIGCARDIASIGVGEARRTFFDGATVVLWRDAEDRFRMDVWNSFASFLARTFETGCRELAAEAA